MPERPAVHAGEQRRGLDAGGTQLVARQGDQLVVDPGGHVRSAEAARVDPNEHVLVGRTPFPLLRRPRAREDVGSPRCAARDSRTRRVAATSAREYASETTTDDAYGISACAAAELGVEVGEKLGRRERRRREDDPVGLDRLAVVELDPIARRE